MAIVTSDPYEASYYLMNGCEIVAVLVGKRSGGAHCQLQFVGQDIEQLQLKYLHGHAVVNLIIFRRAYVEVMRIFSRAKQDAKDSRALRELGGLNGKVAQ